MDDDLQQKAEAARLRIADLWKGIGDKGADYRHAVEVATDAAGIMIALESVLMVVIPALRGQRDEAREWRRRAVAAFMNGRKVALPCPSCSDDGYDGCTPGCEVRALLSAVES